MRSGLRRKQHPRSIGTATKPVSNTSPETLPGTPRNIFAAALLAMSGGMLDAIVWLLHGHVFATAMTGNTVLLGVSLLSHDPRQALRHLVPLITFASGILLGWWMLHRTPDAGKAHRVALLFQIVALAVAGFAPAGFPSPPLVMLVAISASVQIASFQRLDNVTYNTTFVTGNVRTLVEAAFDSRIPERHGKAIQQIAVLVPICIGFFCGVLAGAASALHLQNHSFWLVDAVLLAVLLLLR